MSATWSQIEEVRLKISDPPGVIDLTYVANYAALPESPVRQTAYRTDDTYLYYVYDFDLSAWELQTLRISDARLDSLITLWGTDGAVTRALRAIMASLGQEMHITRLSKGADSTDYLTLKDAYEYYKMLISQFEVEANEDNGTSTGRYYHTRRPKIAGGFI